MNEKFDNIKNCDELEEFANDFAKEELETLDQEIQAIKDKDDKDFLEVAEELSTDNLTTRTIVLIECSNADCLESSEYDPESDFLSEEQTMNRAAQHFDGDYVEIDGCYYCSSCYEDMVNDGKNDAINELIETRKNQIREEKRITEQKNLAAVKEKIAERWAAVKEKRESRIRERISYGLAAIDTMIQARLAMQEKKKETLWTAKSSLTEKQIEWITTVYSTPWHEYQAYKECRD